MRYVLLLLLVSTSLCSQGQRSRVMDSLLARASAMRNDTAKAELLNTISMNYTAQGKAGEALRYAKQALALSQRLGWQTGELDAYNELGNLYETSADYPAALDAYFRALRVAEEIKSEIGKAALYGNISNVYLRQKDYNQALQYNFKFLRIAEKMATSQIAEQREDGRMGMLMALGSIGSVYSEKGDYANGLVYKQRALAIAEADADTGLIAINYANIGFTYLKLRQFSHSLDYSFRALRLSEKWGSDELQAGTLGNIGGAYLAIAVDSTAIEPDSLIPTNKNVALRKAIEYLEQGAIVSRKAGFYPTLMEISKDLAEAYARRGDFRAALAAQREFISAKDSIFNMENSAQIHNLETKRALDLKEKDIEIGRLEVAKKRNERVFFMAGIALLLLVMGLLFRMFRKQQQSNTLLQKEKKRSDDLLLNILPAEVAEELKEKGGSLARQYDEVSILFTDFADFTGTATQLSPQALVEELNECFTAFDTIIERSGLEKIKTIGDAYMAVCGLPVGDPRHACKTVQAALEIRDFIANRQGQKRALSIRIGVNSGPVVAGIIGVKKFAYDVWGDAVNTAARMEQNGAVGRVNISAATYDLVKDHFQCTYRGEVATKGKGAMGMYFVEAAN